MSTYSTCLVFVCPYTPTLRLAASLIPLLVSVAVDVVLLVGLVALFLVCRRRRRGGRTLPKSSFRKRKQSKRPSPRCFGYLVDVLDISTPKKPTSLHLDTVTVSNTVPAAMLTIGDTNKYGGRTAVGDEDEEEEDDYVNAEDDYVSVEGLTCHDNYEDQVNDQTYVNIPYRLFTLSLLYRS